MSEMKAGLQGTNGTFRIASLPVPAVRPDGVLIKVRAVGICGSDLHDYGSKPVAETVPSGHEIAGGIIEVGKGVEGSRVGERVAIDAAEAAACRRCRYCHIGQYFHCEDPVESGGGGFADYIARGAAGCYNLPDNLSWEEGALVEPMAVSVHGIRRGRLHGGETVAVLGAGSIGLTAVAAARALGAGKVFVTARHPHQADMARRLGADDAVPPDEEALLETIADATNGRGADLTVETVGGGDEAILKQAMKVTRRLGRIVVLGLFTRPVTLDWKHSLLQEHEIIFAVHYGVTDGRHDYEIAIDLMASGRAPVKQMVTHKFPLAEIQKAFETASDKLTGSVKVQIHS